MSHPVNASDGRFSGSWPSAIVRDLMPVHPANAPVSTVLTDPGIVRRPSAVQFSNASAPIVCSDSGRMTLDSPVQFMKYPMGRQLAGSVNVTVSRVLIALKGLVVLEPLSPRARPKVISVMLQFRNASLFMSRPSVPLSNVTDFRLSHPLKAYSLTLSTLLGMLISVNDVHSANADDCMSVSPSDSVTLVSDEHPLNASGPIRFMLHGIVTAVSALQF